MAAGLPLSLSSTHVPDVFNLIASSLSPLNPAARKQASQMLEACQAIPGFCAVLQAIFVDGARPDDARLMALICAKLTVTAQWQPRRMRGLFARRGADSGSARAPTGCVSDAEKAHVRAALLQQLGEPDAKLRLQLSILIAKVARFDWDSAWPELFETLLAALRSDSPPHRCGGALTMYRCVKELSTKRMLSDRTRFARTAAQLLPPVLPLWEECVAKLLARLAALCQAGATLPTLAQLRASHDPVAAARALSAQISVELAGAEQDAAMCKHVTKVLYQCGKAAFNTSADEPPTRRLFQAALEQRSTLLRCRAALRALGAQLDALGLPAAPRAPHSAGAAAHKSHAAPPALLDALVDHVEGVLTRSAQLVRETQADHPVAFVPYLRTFLEHHYTVVVDAATSLLADPSCSSDGGVSGVGSPAGDRSPAARAAPGSASAAADSDSFRLLTVHSLRFLANVFDCEAYRAHSVAGATAGEQRAASTSAALSGFMTETRTVEMCGALLGAMLHLRADDLALWARDGEEFVHRQASLGDKEHLRPAAESLLLALHSMPTRSALVVRCVLDNARRCEAAFSADSALYAADPSPDALDGAPAARRRAMNAMRPTLNRDAAYLALGVLSFELVSFFYVPLHFTRILLTV